MSFNASAQQSTWPQQPPQAQNQPAGVRKAVVNAREFKGKVATKEDIFRILKYEGQFFLPPIDQCSFVFLRECLAGRKMLLKCKDVVPVHVPRFKQFSVRRLLEWSLAEPQLHLYLPNFEVDITHPSFTISKDFLFTLVATLKPSFWQQQIDDALLLRQQQQAAREQSQIEITEDFYNLLRASKHISTASKGRALGQLATSQADQPQRAFNSSTKQRLNTSPSAQRTAPSSNQRPSPAQGVSAFSI